MRIAMFGLCSVLAVVTAPLARADPAQLIQAVQLADAMEVRRLLGAGVDPNASTNSRSPLGWAAQAGNLEVVQALIDGGANLDAVDNVGHTPLMRAIDTHNGAIALALLGAGADPNVSDDGDTAAAMAIGSGQERVVRALAKKGANLDTLSADGESALLAMIRYAPENKLAMVRLLGELNADMDLGSAYETPLSYAVSQGEEDTVRTLLAAGADPNAVAPEGKAPILEAASESTLLRMLLDAGADPEAVNRWGESALFAVIDYGTADDVRAMAEAGADLDRRSESGQTPLDRAEAVGREDIASALRALGAGPQEIDVTDVEPAPKPAFLGDANAEFAAMPKLEELSSLSSVGGGVTYFSGASVAALIDFYHQQLASNGWVAKEEMTDRENYLTATYARGDESLTFSLGADSSADPPRVMVSLVPIGDMSTSELPRYPDMEALYESAATSIYVTPASVKEVADKTLQLLRADGWSGEVRVNQEDTQLLELTKNGSVLQVHIGVAPAQGGKTTAQYSLTKEGV